MRKRILLLFILCAAACAGVWALVRFTDARRKGLIKSATDVFNSTRTPVDAWTQAVEKVKENRDEYGPVETPPELKHYSERYWFLATQVAEIEKNKIHLCQDFLDLAAMIQRGEMIPLPAVTDTYVLYGVGEKADEAEFSTFEEDTRNTELDSEAKLNVEKRANPAGYESLQALAKNFNGRSYDLNNPVDRQALKINMLSVLRPQALKIMEEVASAYYRQFDRPLPVSSLVRPEQYQHALRKVNRNAVLIEAPPHATGLAFDIDYRYMSGAEQTFVMSELARLKNEGRIEAIRERRANYHVFAFINGTRPGDDLISASLEKAGASVEQTHHAEAKPAKVKQKAKGRTSSLNKGTKRHKKHK